MLETIYIIITALLFFFFGALYTFGKKRNVFVGVASFIAGYAICGVAITALLSWLAFCFGSVIIGVFLLIFAPFILLAPLVIATPGVALCVYGMDKIVNKKRDSIFTR